MKAISSYSKRRIQNVGSPTNLLSATRYDWPGLGSVSQATGAESDEFPRWKRLLDLTCIIVSLPCWLSVFVAVAIWVKLVSRGPLFFCQERVGYKGRLFKIFKFRTMEVNVETRTHEAYFQHLIDTNRPMTKLDAAGDPRIIFGGRFLRALGLDELPQLLNVVRKEMSLVGPRPCTPVELGWYKTWQHERLNALPGITGIWQVNGKNRTTFQQMIEMDIYYVRNASFWLDVMVLLRTGPAILGQVLESRIRFGSKIREGFLKRRTRGSLPATVSHSQSES